MTLDADLQPKIIDAIVAAFPDAQAIYLFGSFGTENEWPSSDADIAILLPPKQAKEVRSLAMHPLNTELASLVRRDVDLINLRCVSTVFRKEIVMADRRIFTADVFAADEFDMLTLSFYQRLNEERSDIIREGLASGRFIA
jgi:uncharacterized protein